MPSGGRKTGLGRLGAGSVFRILLVFRNCRLSRYDHCGSRSQYDSHRRRPDTSSIPTLVIVYSAIASPAGSAAAVEVAHASQYESPVWIGNLFSSILMALLMIAYYMNPEVGALSLCNHYPNRVASLEGSAG